MFEFAYVRTSLIWFLMDILCGEPPQAVARLSQFMRKGNLAERRGCYVAITEKKIHIW